VPVVVVVAVPTCEPVGVMVNVPVREGVGVTVKVGNLVSVGTNACVLVMKGVSVAVGVLSGCGATPTAISPAQ
jgi:hypothetical protein